MKIAKKNVLKFVFGLQKNLLYDIINIYYKYYMKIQCSQRKGDIDMAVLKVTKENFENEVMNSDVPVLIDFWASWCGPCKMIAPIIDEVEKEAEGAKICKINVDEEPGLVSRFNIMSVPTLVLMKNGEVIDKVVGLQSKEEILGLLR